MIDFLTIFRPTKATNLETNSDLFLTVLGTAKPSILGIEKPLVLGTRKPLHTCKLSEESLHSYDSIWLPFADAGAVCVTWLTITNLTPFCHRFSEGDAGDLEVA